MKRIPMLLIVAACAVPAVARADGRADYNAHCASCHGPHGVVRTEKARALKQDIKKLSLRASKMNKAEMIARIETGHGIMPGFKKEMSRERISAIVDYVLALRNNKPRQK